MNQSTLSAFNCDNCNAPFETWNQLVRHVDSSCLKTNLSSQVPQHKSNSTSTDSGPINQSAHDVIAHTRQVIDSRAAPQEEALGYNNTVLLNVESLSNKTKSAIEQSKKQNRTFAEYESESEESYVNSDEDVNYTTMNDLADELGDSDDNEEDPESDDEEFKPVEQLDDDLSESDSDFEGDPWSHWEDKKNAERSHSTFQPKEGIGEHEISPLNVALIDLLWRLDHHHVDLNVFDEIVEWAIFFLKKDPDLFRCFGGAGQTKRKTFLKQLRRMFDSDNLSPKVSNVRLDSGRLVTMPIWNFKHVVVDMLQDDDLMREENFCQENFNKKTWCPQEPVEEFLQSNDDRISLQEEVAKEVEELKKSILPCPKTEEDLLQKTIEVLCQNYVKEGQERTHTSFQWFLGTITEVRSLDKINGAQVIIDWKSSATSRKSTSLWTLDYNLWYQDVLHSWRYPETERNDEQEAKESSWRVTKKSIDDKLSTLPVADVYTGTMLTMGVSRFVERLNPIGITSVRALPIILFIDKSHTDLFGSLATTPISYTLGVFNHLCRRKAHFWRNQAYIPPLHVGKGKKAGSLDLAAYVNEVDRRKKGHGPKPIASVEKLKDYHMLLREALKPFDHACKTGIVVEDKDGSKIMYQPFLLFSIGDTAGNNELCCHHNNSGNSNSPCLCYTCKCSFSDLIKTPVNCKPITVEDINESLVDHNHAKSISQHQVKSAFHDLALADRKGGIMSLMPREWLHVFPQGLFMATTKVIHNLIGTKGKNARHKDHFNMLHQRIAAGLHRNSDRDLPRTASRGAYFDMTCCYGTEKEGNLYCANVCFHTFQGKGIMNPFLKRVHIPMSKFCYTIQLLLSYSAWIHDHKLSRWEVMHALPVVEELMNCMIQYLPNDFVKKGKKVAPKANANDQTNKDNPGEEKNQQSKKRHRSSNNASDSTHVAPEQVRTTDKEDELEEDLQGSNGWHIPKFHSMPQFILSMQRFGSATNFDSSHGEGHHKDFVKKPGKNTNRRVDSFTGQVGQRYDESMLIRRAHSRVSQRCPQRRYAHTYCSVDRDNIEFRGKYVLEMSRLVGRGRSHVQYDFQHVWSDHKKTLNKEQFMLDGLLKQALAKAAHNDKFNTEISLIGYTEVTFPTDATELSGVTFRASPNYRGFQWYDWALVKFPSCEISGDDVGDGLCHRPARVMGFVQYFTPGYPTFNLCKEAGHDPRHVRDQNLKDNETYVVLDCSNNFVSKSDLDGNFVTPFELEPNDSGLRILPMSVIVEPMIVVTNFKAESKVHYLACLPKRKWGNLFRRRIREMHRGIIDSTDHKNDRWWDNSELIQDAIETESEDDTPHEEDEEDDTPHEEEHSC